MAPLSKVAPFSKVWSLHRSQYSSIADLIDRRFRLLPFALVFAVANVACGVDATVPSETAQVSRDPWQWAQEFGGAPAGYAEIMSMADCAALQRRFDVHAGVIESEGRQRARPSIGFMTAAVQRMGVLGCRSIPLVPGE